MKTNTNLNANNDHLPAEGYVRLPQILKVFPIGKSTWWDGVRTGRFPPAIKLGPKITVWRVEDIRALITTGTYTKGGQNV